MRHGPPLQLHARTAGWPAWSWSRPVGALYGPSTLPSTTSAPPLWWAIDDTVTTRGAVGSQQQRQQQPGQHEVAEMVGAELQLEAVAGDRPLRRCHHAGVVDRAGRSARSGSRRTRAPTSSTTGRAAATSTSASAISGPDAFGGAAWPDRCRGRPARRAHRGGECFGALPADAGISASDDRGASATGQAAASPRIQLIWTNLPGFARATPVERGHCGL